MAKSQSVDLVVAPVGRVVTPVPGRAADDPLVIEDAGIAVHEGRIVAVDTAAAITAGWEGEAEVDFGGLVTPGLVDPHTHMVHAGVRVAEYEQRVSGADYQEIAAAGGGIRASVRAFREADAHTLLAEAAGRLLRMLDLGTTLVEIKSGYGLDTDQEMKGLEVAGRLGADTADGGVDWAGEFGLEVPGLGADVVRTFMGAHEVPDEFQDDRDGYVDLVCSEMIPRVAEEGAAEFCDVFCEEGVFTVEQSRRVLEAAADAGLKLKVHANEFGHTGGARLAAEMGAVSADHLMHADDAEIAALAEAGVAAVLLPATTFCLGKDAWAPARRMLDAGLTVALATDCNPGSSPCESQQLVWSLACNYLGMTPAEALHGLTLGAATALDRADSHGAVQPGFAADLCLWDVDIPAEIPARPGTNHLAAWIKSGVIGAEPA